jgi:diacylglycerol kinase (ATP)
MTGPLTIVINPAAGGGAAARCMAQVAAVLDAAGARYTVQESKSLDHARSLAAAAAEGGDTVVAFGGDGLTGALAGAVAEATGRARGASGAPAAGAAPASQPAAFGVIPCGRGNDFARTHGISFEPAAAARLLAEGEPRPVDLIEVSGDAGRATVAGSVYLGVAAVAGEIANQARLIRGPLVYNLAALRALLGWKPTTFRVEAAGADGARIDREFRGYAVVAANVPYFGAGMKVAPDADTSDGLLDVVLMRHAPKLTFVRALMKIKDGSHVDLDQIEVLRASSVTLSTDRPVPAGADGELLACAAPLAAGAPLHVRVLPQALRVIVPR